MFCFEKKLPLAEVTQRFGELFEIEVADRGPDNMYTGTLTLYSMIKK